MKLLLSNDDGVLAPGLRALHEAISPLTECIVVAPDRNCSGVSSALTLDAPLRPVQHDSGFISLNGTPADCVHLALNGFLDDLPQMVMSGINLGANLGDDVLYSGTVGAALEGRFLPYPAIAISLCSSRPDNLESAAYIAKQLFMRVEQLALPPRTILNVNVPDLPWSEIRGVRLTRFGHRTKPAAIESIHDPRGHKGYWIASVGQAEDNAEDTDFHAVVEGYISITPLKVDQTDYEAFAEVEGWLGGLL